MKHKITLSTVAAVLATIFLAACSGGGLGSSSSPTIHQSDSMGGIPFSAMSPITQSAVASATAPRWAAAYAPRAITTTVTKTWMSPQSRQHSRELFISDAGNNDVVVFDFPSMQQLGQLAGLSNPQGLCSDHAGNVWVMAEGSDSAIEYDHAGLVVQTITLSPGNQPVGCAINRGNTKIAIAQLNGDLSIYDLAGNAKTTFTCASMAHAFFAGYRSDGTLFVDGTTAEGNFIACSGRQSLAPMKIKNVTINYPGTVQSYHNTYLVVSDQECGGQFSTCVYILGVNKSGLTATYKSTVTLDDGSGHPICTMPQGALVERNKPILAGGNGTFCGGSESSSALAWDFPNQSAPIAANGTNGVLSEPIGAALSIAKI